MVLVWQRCLLLVLVLSLTVLSGCVGDDPAPEPADEGTVDTTEDQTPTVTESLPPPSDKVLAKVDSKQAVFAPTWNVGQWWTFEAGGADRPSSTSTLAVTSLEEDHYRLGSDSEIELTYNMLHNGPFIPRSEAGIQFDSLAFYSADSYQDYLGFRRPVGDTWDVAIHEWKFKVTKDAVEEVDDPQGAAMGIVVSGVSPGGHTLKVVYSAAAQWITTLRVLDPDGGEILSYKLTDYGESGGPEVQEWQRTGSFRTNAQSPAYPAWASSYSSDGSGDQLVVVLHLRSGHAQGHAYGGVYSPTGDEVASKTVEMGAEWIYLFVSDEEGRWPALVRAIGGNSSDDRAKADIYMMQIKRV